ELTGGGEILRKQRADAMDQIVADGRPLSADRFRADVVRHAGSARREDGEIGPTGLLERELGLDALDEHLVADAEVGRSRPAGGVGEPCQLPVAKNVERLRL